MLPISETTNEEICVFNHDTGYVKYPLEHLQNKDIIFTHTPGVGAPQVAEHTFAMTLSSTRYLLTFRKQQRNREWKKPS